MAYLFHNIRNTGALQYTVFYRLRGSLGPWTNGGTFDATAPPAEFTEISIEDVPANEYEIYYVSVCEDGLLSDPSEIFYSTPICPVPMALNVIEQADSFLVQYTLPPNVAQFNLQVLYPNGGTFNQVLPVESSGEYLLPKPAGVFGDFTFQIRSVCNVGTGWYSPFTNQVLITVPDTTECPAVTITGAARIGTSVGSDTWRFTLGGYTSSVRVVITNTTTGGPQQILTQAVTDNFIDVPLVKSSVDYIYQVQVFNLCTGATDFIGDEIVVTVFANTTTVSTAGWTVTASPDTSDINGDGVIGTRVDVVAPATPSATRDTEVSIRFTCSGIGFAYVTVIIAAGQTSGVARDWNSGCTIDLLSAYINSAILL